MSLRVRDVMSEVPELEGDETVGAALAANPHATAEVALVRLDEATAPAIVRLDALRAAPEETALADLVAGGSALVLEPDLPIEAAVERLAKALVADRSLAGALVARG